MRQVVIIHKDSMITFDANKSRAYNGSTWITDNNYEFEDFMDINKAFNDVSTYIEKNLTGTIDYEEAAKIMCVSVFHFQRLFSYLTGTPIAEYIRNRKMTLAGFDIQKTDEKIIDIAMKYGYESHSSFCRAFQAFHNATPSEIREHKKSLKVCLPIHMHFAIQGNDMIQFRIEKTDTFQVFGKEDFVLPVDRMYAKDVIVEYGDRIIDNGTHDAINNAAGFRSCDEEYIHLLHGFYFKDTDGKMRFMYGWEVPDHELGDEFTVLTVPPTSWAVFTYHGEHMEALPKVWTYIYTDWQYSSIYKTDENIIIQKETFTDPDETMILAEVWLPLIE